MSNASDRKEEGKCIQKFHSIRRGKGIEKRTRTNGGVSRKKIKAEGTRCAQTKDVGPHDITDEKTRGCRSRKRVKSMGIGLEHKKSAREKLGYRQNWRRKGEEWARVVTGWVGIFLLLRV